MRLVEKHIIRPSHQHYDEIDKICFLSKNLYNRANYIIRQKFIETSEQKAAGIRQHAVWMRYNELQKLLQNSNDPDYMALPRKVSQWVLKILDKNWKSFFKSAKAYKKNSGKYNGRPKLPGYKHKADGRNILVYTIQAISKPALIKGILQPSGTTVGLRIIHNQKVKQARIVPLLNRFYKIEIVYEKQVEKRDLDKSRIAGIDIGINNLAAVTSNQRHFQPLLINGRPVKSINQYYNKKRAALQSELTKKHPNRHSSRQIESLTFKRTCKIEDYFNKASRFLIDLLSEYGIGTLLIGKNKNWKQDINLGSRNNQSFVSIPHARFIAMLKYKADMVGMRVIVREESHTSKCSFLDNEAIKHHKAYVGKRISRGLFRSREGVIINADCNGSGNIIRKEIPNAFADGIEGVVVRPVIVTVPVTGKPVLHRQPHIQVA